MATKITFDRLLEAQRLARANGRAWGSLTLCYQAMSQSDYVLQWEDGKSAPWEGLIFSREGEDLALVDGSGGILPYESVREFLTHFFQDGCPELDDLQPDEPVSSS